MSASEDHIRRLLQLGLLGVGTGDDAMSAVGANLIKQSNTEEAQSGPSLPTHVQGSWFQDPDTGDLFQHPGMAAAELAAQKRKDAQGDLHDQQWYDHADYRTDQIVNRPRIMKGRGPDGDVLYEVTPGTGEVKVINPGVNAPVPGKAKQEAASLENAASRLQALYEQAKTDSDIFSPGKDALVEGASHIPLIGDVARNVAADTYTPKQLAFRTSEASINNDVQQMLGGKGMSEENRRVFSRMFPFTPGTMDGEFLARAPASIATLNQMAAARRNANYNPVTRTGGSPAPQASAPATVPSGTEHWEIVNGRPQRVQ